ncbi:hypothetical protein DRE_02167 [Drechslerella stenobrocha 248]|uniref:Uncharacterized protein n=1 Tax=Drechslerella stenobrocha 248 TaxID=1043628 RepID=W7I7T4_9PEZI|nr:hypothetical protein DRE_02167 [Drechslerella stenobrocha 248]
MTQLVNKLAHEVPEAKCYITCGNLPGESAAGVSSRRPFSTILGHVYNQQVDVLLPDGVCEMVRLKLEEQLKPLQYHRVFMGLKAILDKEFYNNYIRQGNILLLSDGRVDVDNVYCLYDGTLYLFLTKEMYEKAGLVGKKAAFGGRKKERWVVEHDLRQPHMLHGKKAFDRLVWSFTNVFKEQKSWLFCDLNQEALNPPPANPNPGPSTTITGLTVPTTPRTAAPEVTRAAHATKLASFVHTVPQLSTTEYDRAVFYDWAYALHEWIALATLDADRLHAADSIDPFLSRYEPPTATADGPPATGDLAKISWRGFIPAEYISRIFGVLQSCVPADQWFSITAHGFQNAPVSWKGRQHGVVGGGAGGENLYTVLRLAASTVDGELQGQRGVTDDVVMEGVEGPVGGADAVQQARYIMWEVVGGRDQHS